MPDSDYTPTKRSLAPQIITILIAHFVFAFATFFLMYFFSLFLDEAAAQTVASVVSIILFIAMVYVEAWRVGGQDANLVNFGHMEYDKFRGLKAGAYSQIVGLVLIIAAIVYELTGYPHWIFLSAFKLFYGPFVDIIWLMSQATPFLYFLLLLVAPCAYHIGYSLGYKGFSIGEKLIYKKKPDREREKKFR
ncbi:MAG: hypothetical protein LBL09_02990 [Oscillospiraceae bacterium]|jgi:hypothetical protein|nr:hypothetical protein [Oscillospiraceae bacterium]